MFKEVCAENFTIVKRAFANGTDRISQLAARLLLMA